MIAAAAEGPPLAKASRICFFAHFHPMGIAADYVLHYLAELRKAGFATVVASTADLIEGEAEKLREACDDLILRENQGLDFGSWIACWRKWAPLDADLLLLCNDSVYGPIGNLADSIERLIASPADFYGMVASDELAPHFQSWFLLLRPAAYRSSAFQDLLSHPIPEGLAKTEIIRRYEVGLTTALRQDGLQGYSLYEPPHDPLFKLVVPFNASHLLWRELVTEFGIPFIKVELLRDNPMMVDDLERWPEVVTARSPELVDWIGADVDARRRAAAPSPKRRGGVRTALRRIFVRWLRGCVARDLRYRRDGRGVALRLNFLYFAIGRFVSRVVRMSAMTVGLASKR